jgi:hypothetical protein
MTTHTRTGNVGRVGSATVFGMLFVAVGLLGACGGERAAPAGDMESTARALGNPGGAQACVVGTASLRIGARVATSGGLAANSLTMESGAVANGGANINNVNGALVRISGATINGTVRIAGAAPSAANGELVNGGRINGPVITGAGLQAVLPAHAVTPGTTAVNVNAGDPPRAVAPGSYAAVSINGSRATFTAGTYNLASLTVNSGATVVLNTTAGAVTINVSGTITVNGGTLTAGDPSLVTFYSNSAAGNAVSINAGVAAFPGTVTAPNGGIGVGSRVTVSGCVGARNVSFDPDATLKSIETLIVPTDGSSVFSQFSYPAGANVTIRIAGLVVWGGCDPVNCPNGGSCNFIRLGDAQFHSDNCFTGSDPTFHAPAFDFPIQLFLDGGPLPTTPFAPSHVYTFVVPGNGGPFVFNYNDIPGTFVDNSGTFTVTISTP